MLVQGSVAERAPVSHRLNPSLCCRKNNQLRGLCTAAVPGRVLSSHEIKDFLMLEDEMLCPSLWHIFLHLNPLWLWPGGLSLSPGCDALGF